MCTEKQLQIVTKNIVETVVEHLSDKINRIVLYGSCARGDFDTESDVDILIILNCSREEIRKYRKDISKLASRLSLANDIEVSFVLVDKQSYEQRKELLPFYQNIQREGIALYG